MADYVTAAEVKANLPEAGFASTDTTYDGVIGGIVTAVSRLIDREVGRGDNYFLPSTNAAVRYYDGSGKSRQWIDDAVTVSEVAVSEVGGLNSSDYAVYPTSDYFTYPYNDTPARAIVLDRLNGSQSYFPRYRKNVRVTAVFGYAAAVPALVSQAALIQSTRLFMRTKQAYADNGASGEVGQMTINVGSRRDIVPTLDNDVRAMLYPYKLENFGVDDD
jgi:hypothetical protein